MMAPPNRGQSSKRARKKNGGSGTSSGAGTGGDRGLISGRCSGRARGGSGGNRIPRCHRLVAAWPTLDHEGAQRIKQRRDVNRLAIMVMFDRRRKSITQQSTPHHCEYSSQKKIYILLFCSCRLPLDTCFAGGAAFGFFSPCQMLVRLSRVPLQTLRLLGFDLIPPCAFLAPRVPSAQDVAAAVDGMLLDLARGRYPTDGCFFRSSQFFSGIISSAHLKYPPPEL